MGRCRCDEISYCKNQISVLDDASNLLNSYTSNMTEIANDLRTLSLYNEEAYPSSHKEDMIVTIKGLDDAMVAIKAKVHQRIIDKKTHLSNRLREIEQEDTKFHEEEEVELSWANGTISK